jgi:RNA polymerase sigma-70 factor (ECF subfamily)
MGDNPFAELISRIRSGDARAAEELVRQYEPVIRLEVRMRLRDTRLRRAFDSMDICQSVLASFFVRATAGQFDLNEPGQLVRLLVGMARRKLAFQVRKQRAQRRDHRRIQAGEPVVQEAAGSDPTPSQVVATEELLREFRQRLTEEERRLAERRASSASWADIAAELGGTAQGRRKQLERAVDRVSRELDLD